MAHPSPLQSDSSLKSKINISLLLLILASGLALFWNLGKVPLFEPDEGRYADIALHMVKTGDWLVPHMNDVVHLHKPPLSGWAVASCFKIFGVSELSARLPSVLASLLVLLGTAGLGRFFFDLKSGVNAGWILLTSALYLVVSRLVTTDMLLVFFVFLTMVSLAKLFFGTSHKVLYFYLAVLGASLGMLTKGPVAWMLTLLPALVFGLWRKRGFQIPRPHWFLGLTLFAGISLSWYLAIVFESREALTYFVKFQLWGRMAKDDFYRSEPFYYFLIVLPLGFLPWSIFLPSAYLQERKEQNSEMRDKIRFLWVWVLIPLLFFSLFKTKLATYVVPLFPPLALLLGYFWKKLQDQEIIADTGLKISFRILAFAYLAIAVNGLIFVHYFPKFVEGIPKWAMDTAAGILTVTALAVLKVLGTKNWRNLFRLQIISLFLLVLFAFQILPQIEFRNRKLFAETILKSRKPGDYVIMFKHYLPSLPFYLGEKVILVGNTIEEEPFKQESAEPYIFEFQDEIRKFFDRPERKWVILPKKFLHDFLDRVNTPVYTIGDNGGYLLVSDKPEGENREVLRLN